MRNVSVVIGANYGDEGKGLATDYLSNNKTLVVRHNSGAQAGHTVNTADGRRHVFHQFGSGSFQGATTFLSEHFVLHPMVFGRELKQLNKLGVQPRIYIDPEAIVTTPFDVMINQAVEESRGHNRHGSCGMGFSETIERNEADLFKLTYNELYDVPKLFDKLNNIRKYYIPARMKQLGVNVDLPYLMDDRIINRFVRDCQNMIDSSSMIRWIMIGKLWEHDIVFESAQGLRLDMDGRDFPHVTRSKTGLANAASLIEEAGITQEVNAYYISRTYLTRHGAGPLAHEIKGGLPYPEVKDETNVYNPFQQGLRFAYLNKQQMIGDIIHDLRHSKSIKVNPHLFLTCVDQTSSPEGVLYIEEDGSLQFDHYRAFAKTISWKIEGKNTFYSAGNRREYVFN